MNPTLQMIEDYLKALGAVLLIPIVVIIQLLNLAPSTVPRGTVAQDICDWTRAQVGKLGKIALWYALLCTTFAGLFIGSVYVHYIAPAVFFGALLSLMFLIAFLIANTASTAAGWGPASNIAALTMLPVFVILLMLVMPSMFSGFGAFLLGALVCVGFLIYIWNIVTGKAGSTLLPGMMVWAAVLVLVWGIAGAMLPGYFLYLQSSKTLFDVIAGILAHGNLAASFTEGTVIEGPTTAYIAEVGRDGQTLLNAKPAGLPKQKPGQRLRIVNISSIYKADGSDYYEVELPGPDGEYPPTSPHYFMWLPRVRPDQKQTGSSFTVQAAPAAPAPIAATASVAPSASRNADGSWSAVVPAIASGVTLQSGSDEFFVNSGDTIEIVANGNVDIGRGPVGPDGERTGYRDTSMDSPFVDHVGGLEMWVGGDKSTNRELVGQHFTKKMSHTGVLTLRVIESIQGYTDGNKGAFTVTVRKK